MQNPNVIHAANDRGSVTTLKTDSSKKSIPHPRTMSPMLNGPIRRPNQISVNPSRVDDARMKTSSNLNAPPKTMALTKTHGNGTIVLKSIVMARLFMIIYTNSGISVTQYRFGAIFLHSFQGDGEPKNLCWQGLFGIWLEGADD